MDELEPKLVEVLKDIYVIHIACGTNHTMCITNEGFVYTWGSAMNGKLGITSKATKD
jgi:alpha-tubulin suppressor-like RCC1 family protein